MKRFLSAMLCVVVLVACCTLTSMAFGGSLTATLTTDATEAYSATCGCHTVKYYAENSRDSAGSLDVAAQLSTGIGWVSHKQMTISPGSSVETGSIGNASITYLCRGFISVTSGGTGCSGHITVTVTS